MTQKIHLLVVEDDPVVGRYVEKIVQHRGMLCSTASRAEEAHELLKTRGAGAFDLILLDVMLPDQLGWDFMDELQARGDDTPVIILTGLGNVDKRVKGLQLGADDYIVKPFLGNELLARIDAVLRRRQQLPRLTIGDLVIDVAHRVVTRADKRIDLSPREFDLLLYMAEAGGRIVPKAELLREIWDLKFDPGTTVVEVALTRLRGKVDRFGPPMIQTVVKQGYQLVAREILDQST
jgi:DNA-binding response OmpR family regulator